MKRTQQVRKSAFRSRSEVKRAQAQAERTDAARWVQDLQRTAQSKLPTDVITGADGRRRRFFGWDS